MEHIRLDIKLHPFNQKAMNALLINSPKFANGNTPDSMSIQQKKQVYNQIKQMDHDGSNNVYNLFFEHIVTVLN